MDQAILNLMLSNMDGSTEDSSSETNSIIDEFELMNTQSKGNCCQKLKSILQQAGKLIKLKDEQIESKDQQIDNHVKTISTLSIKCLEIHKHYMENQMAEKNKEVSQILSKYPDQLKESMAPSNETNEALNSHETIKEQLRDQLADQAKAREDQLNALLEESNKKVENLIAQLSEAESKLKEANTFLQESNEKVKMLEIEKQQMENKLTLKINEYEILIKNNETKIKNSDNKEHKSIIHVTGWRSQKVTINNDIAGPSWIVIKRSERQSGSLKKTIDVDSSWVYDLTKDHPHELYIHLVYKDGTTSFAHYDEFALHDWNGSVYKIKSMGALRTSMAIVGDFCGKSVDNFWITFESECTLICTFMVRQRLKYQLHN
ncbi:protein Hook homolog 1-like [Drosophila willistoni]|uniref:protein Hook homolog 1-like n=1 Tax=Drosophila willistoni TaxID=7260 RepID=UPI001F07F2A8|nr:protein Hook homolog 1-like [Drosophila willistoni]